MRRAVIVAALLISAASLHATVERYDLSGTYSTFESCVLAGNASRLKFNCQETTPACAARPADLLNTCALPSIGEWTSTAIAAASPACWTFTPTAAPIGACITPPPVPPPEPLPDMSGTAVFVDKAKVPAGLINAGASTFDVRATTEIAPPSSVGAFRTVCSLSHMGFDDPIVFPGQAGRSHLHYFFGNSGTNANSTAESLRTTGTSTCRGGIANRSAYWVPAMVDTKDGTPLVPLDVSVYYKAGNLLDSATINSLPVGLRMIAGDPTRTTPGGHARFKCIGGPNAENDKYGSAIGNCDVGARLISEVFFPQCWDGVNLDSPDHKSHMSYTVAVRQADGTLKQQCPTTHRVAIPDITFNVEYLVTEKDAPLRWRLASDNYLRSLPGGYSSHGDWFNGWQSPVSDAWAAGCIRAKKDCHSHLLGDGRAIY